MSRSLPTMLEWHHAIRESPLSAVASRSAVSSHVHIPRLCASFRVQQSLSEVFERAMQAEGLGVREVVVECILLDAGATEGDQV